MHHGLQGREVSAVRWRRLDQGAEPVDEYVPGPTAAEMRSAFLEGGGYARLTHYGKITDSVTDKEVDGHQLWSKQRVQIMVDIDNYLRSAGLPTGISTRRKGSQKRSKLRRIASKATWRHPATRRCAIHNQQCGSAVLLWRGHIGACQGGCDHRLQEVRSGAHLQDRRPTRRSHALRRGPRAGA